MIRTTKRRQRWKNWIKKVKTVKTITVFLEELLSFPKEKGREKRK